MSGTTTAQRTADMDKQAEPELNAYYCVEQAARALQEGAKVAADATTVPGERAALDSRFGMYAGLADLWRQLGELIQARTIYQPKPKDDDSDRRR